LEVRDDLDAAFDFFGKPAFMLAYDLSLTVDLLFGRLVPAFFRAFIFSYKLIT